MSLVCADVGEGVGVGVGDVMGVVSSAIAPPYDQLCRTRVCSSLSTGIPRFFRYGCLCVAPFWFDVLHFTFFLCVE